MYAEGKTARGQVADAGLQLLEVLAQGRPPVHDQEDVPVGVIDPAAGPQRPVGRHGLKPQAEEALLAALHQLRQLRHGPQHTVPV